jgi:hypothetical protein
LVVVHESNLRTRIIMIGGCPWKQFKDKDYNDGVKWLFCPCLWISGACIARSSPWKIARAFATSMPKSPWGLEKFWSSQNYHSIWVVNVHS